MSCEQSVYTSSPDGQTTQNRKVFIQSKPSHATIYLNDKNLGIQTPDTVKWLPADNNIITLKLPLYSDTTFSVNVLAGQTKNVFVDFTLNTKNVGKIDCTSNPNGADIWLNDTLTNKKTPITLSRLVPGNYKVKFTTALHRPDSSDVTVIASTTANVFLTLEDTSKWVSYNKRNSQTISNYISAITCDKQNKIWIGTDRGLMSFSGKKFVTYTMQNSPLPSDIITCVAVDEQNRKWIGTENGLMIFDNGVWSDYSSNLPDLNLTAITFDHSGDTWIGTQKGLVQYSNGSWQTFTITNSGLKENFVTCIAVDKSNRIWIGSVFNGISLYDGKSWSFFNNSNTDIEYVSLEYVQAMTTDKLGRVWVSVLNTDSKTTDLIFYDGSGWSKYTNSAFLFNLTYSLYAKNEHLIFGNKNRLCVLNDDMGILTSYDTANSALPLYRIQTITMDNANNIWFGTFEDGIGKFKVGNF
ncbi:MAG: PEGA domain-containing protein [Bacteroidetes bacterium]|nr:PEGA domain-containing protein [Bacteroidota bacterium]